MLLLCKKYRAVASSRPQALPLLTYPAGTPNLDAHDVIVPGTARLAFTIALVSEDANRNGVQNLGRAIVKKLTIKISGNEVMSTTLMASTVTMISGRQAQRGQMVIIGGSKPLITKT